MAIGTVSATTSCLRWKQARQHRHPPQVPRRPVLQQTPQSAQDRNRCQGQPTCLRLRLSRHSRRIHHRAAAENSTRVAGLSVRPLTGQVLPALTGQDETGENIELVADGAESPDGNTYHLQGNAIIRYEQQELRADSIVYERSTGDVEASGGIQLSGTGFIINAATAELQIEAQQGILHQVEFTLPNQHARGKAAQLSLDGIENLHLEKASYTTCPEGNENWILLAREVNLDREDGRGTARDAKLKFKGVPLLYTPYFSFPIDERRKSGLLIPKIGQSDTPEPISASPITGISLLTVMQRLFRD